MPPGGNPTGPGAGPRPVPPPSGPGTVRPTGVLPVVPGTAPPAARAGVPTGNPNGPATAARPTLPGGRPPTGPGSGGSSGRLIAIGASAAAVLIVVLLTVVLLNGNDGGGTPPGTNGPIAGRSTGPNEPPNTEFDDAFSSAALRDYVRPYYDDIESCEKTTTINLASVNCTYLNKVEVAVFELPSGTDVADVRELLGAQLTDADKTTWQDGELWTAVGSGGPALYWDVESKRFAGLAVLPGGELDALKSWWEESFGS